jgi:hypothetical protein
MGSREVFRAFEALLDKSQKSFNKLRDLPPYGNSQWERHFQKAFHVYSKLWKFQQENRWAPPSARSGGGQPRTGHGRCRRAQDCSRHAGVMLLQSSSMRRSRCCCIHEEAGPVAEDEKRPWLGGGYIHGGYSLAEVGRLRTVDSTSGRCAGQRLKQ